MATSGATNYILTAREVITYALRKINLVPLNQDPPAAEAEAARIELNVLLKSWQKYPGVWRLTEGSATPVANTAAISLSSLNPYRVIDCRYRNTSSLDLPMEELNRQEYYDLPSKSSTGVPTTWYFDPQRGSNTLYIWPVLSSVTTETIQMTYQRRFEDVGDLAEHVDIAQEHLDVVGHCLASRLADSYGRKGAHIDRIIARSQMYEQEMLDADRPEHVQFLPERRYYG